MPNYSVLQRWQLSLNVKQINVFFVDADKQGPQFHLPFECSLDGLFLLEQDGERVVHRRLQNDRS